MAFSVRDVPVFLRSARTDARALALRQKHGADIAFDRLYAELGDPWHAETPRRSYQSRKNERLLSLLPDGAFSNVLDIGCGLGGMSRLVASRARNVVGTDLSASAVVAAELASACHANVRHVQADILDLPDEFDARFDLVIVADVLYYIDVLDDGLLKRLVGDITATLAPGGYCLLADHYFSPFDRESRASLRIHDAFRWSLGLRHLRQHRGRFFVADLLQRCDARPAS